MKTLLFLFSLSVAAHATIIYVDSGLSTTNSSGRPTAEFAGEAETLPGSEWISYAPTGDPGYLSSPDVTLVTFTANFTLSGAITGGSLDVLADDSTFVVLNGHPIIAAVTRLDARCSGRPVRCLTSAEEVFTFAEMAPYLVDGTNTLSFGGVQVAGSSFGLDFAGRINDDDTPEPATLGFLGSGLAALTLMRRKGHHLVI